MSASVLRRDPSFLSAPAARFVTLPAGLRAVAITDAVLESARAGGWVDAPSTQAPAGVA